MAPTGKTVTRVDILTRFIATSACPRDESVDMAELVLKEITDCIARGETIKLSSFGTFTIRKKSERLGRNPKTVFKCNCSCCVQSVPDCVNAKWPCPSKLQTFRDNVRRSSIRP
jgi:nucleoid DNA-binding protein